MSGWVATEVSSALSIKIRRKELSVDDRNAILSEWRGLCAASFEDLPIAADQFDKAISFADRHDLGLRAGDALHVAIAAAHGCTLVTLDRVLAAAAPQCGVPVAAF